LSLANHTASDWIIDTQADYGVPGLRHKECTVCHRELEREPISALAPETDSVNILVGLSKTYDGTAVTLDIANIEVASNRTPTIEWYEGNTKLASAPVNAGSYSVKAFVPSTKRWSEAYDIEYFTITKANGNIYDVDISSLNKEYDGTPADINQITFSTNVEVPLLVEWYKEETLLPSAPVDAGDYSIKLYSDDNNFIDTSYTGYFTISKKTLTLPSLDDIYLPEGEYVTLSEENGVIAGETVELYPDNDDHLCIGRYTDVALHITDDNYVLSGAAVASKYLVYEEISPYAVVNTVTTVKVGLNTFYVVIISLIEGTIEVNKPLYLPTGETITPLSLSLDKTTTNMLSYADSGDKVLQISASGPKPEAGQIITDRIDHTDTVVFKAILYLHTEAEGGRHSPIMDEYKPSKIKMSDKDIVTSDITIKFIGDREMLLPGETAEVYFILGAKIPLRVGMTFDILEGTKVVGDGMVSGLVEEEHDYSGDGVCACGHSIVETVSAPDAISKVFTADTYYYFKAPFEAGTYSYAFPAGVTGSISVCDLDGNAVNYDSLYQERFDIPTDGTYLVIVKVNNPLNSTMTLLLNTYL
ncbi:MAG: MBG domain-containing protein, partial [bacterium]|nr:MBG domain-containing protein [bacterium]